MHWVSLKSMSRILLSGFAVLFWAVAVHAEPQDQAWNSQGVIHLKSSPHAKLHMVPIRAVKMGEGFWASRMRINVEKSIPTMLQLLEDHGIVDNFRRLSGKKKVDRRGPLYTDSDIYKWIEAVAFVLQSGDRPKLRATVDSLVEEILAVQEPSGYLNTYWVDDRKERRFKEMGRGHELYCLGHMLQAGIAYYRATGNRKLMDGGIRFADYLVENFGFEKRPALSGHPELEMALVELYRTTGDRRHLEFARYLLSSDERERLGLVESRIRYMFSGKPFTSRTQLEGHAVRAMYAVSGATDYYMETGDNAFRQTLETLWNDLVGGKMCITGGVGSRSRGEAIGDPFELPNALAYGESCAAIGNAMWNWRMMFMTGKSQFADIAERALYNGANSGMSLSGTLYCYQNPLEARGENFRNEWYDTTCCPPNLERTFASIPGYLYGTSPAGVYVNLYHSSDLAWHLEDGTPLKISQKTEYPWKGTVRLQVTPGTASDFTLFLRIPGWAAKATVEVNGRPVERPVLSGEYFEIRRRWTEGDKVELNLDMTPQVIASNPLVRENVGRVTVERGPLVYCLEQTDHLGMESIFDGSLSLGADPGKDFQVAFRPDLLGGIVVLQHKGVETYKPISSRPLYQSLRMVGRPEYRGVDLTLIPYYAWHNRGATSMEVWIPYGEKP